MRQSTPIGQPTPDTVGCNWFKIFGTPRCRNSSRTYSRQYERSYRSIGSRIHGLSAENNQLGGIFIP
ncbi:hypothetical protein E6P09_06610 [Haloferax mediterranei ATCC 33500]|uniref:Uncharacterized protein n=1 Tax=Haloferax mediterranei (strain ATCC 33500 / DSM 1411 / JCM 8866 / NBRC 14739 / NCIMB 2177 / R-4) TaxID=523841 RepID=A0A4P8P383_HALMT|nr:hypothetical protein E6P09_06610 [Haloferax mediterranei ATCC 33500]